MSTLMVSFLLVLFQFLIFSVQAQSGEWETPPPPPPTEFIFKGFRENNNSEIQTEGAAAIKPDGLLRLTDGNLSVTGTAFYRKPSLPALATEVVSASPSHYLPPQTVQAPTLANTLDLSTRPTTGIQRTTFSQSSSILYKGFKDGTRATTGNHIGLNFNSVTSDVPGPGSLYN
ncbi:hypothetical protein F2Q69_00057744 [Brassica cretica]|uniref:Legume lectin domain-containing protein n=1 Tax=Brassica cretica TaxID=69181 RepID=A0A8S9MQ99_BRACR|nr:hypothetical protein F2Q69_00057744 [Brassica cretica]